MWAFARGRAARIIDFDGTKDSLDQSKDALAELSYPQEAQTADDRDDEQMYDDLVRSVTDEDLQRFAAEEVQLREYRSHTPIDWRCRSWRGGNSVRDTYGSTVPRITYHLSPRPAVSHSFRDPHHKFLRVLFIFPIFRDATGGFYK